MAVSIDSGSYLWNILIKVKEKGCKETYAIRIYDCKNAALTDIKTNLLIETESKKKVVELLTELYFYHKCSFRTSDGRRFEYYLGRSTFEDLVHVKDHFGFDFEEEYRTQKWRW